MEIITIQNVEVDKKAPVPLRKIFEEILADANVTVGTVIIPPGKRVPLKGVASHEQNEYSIVVKGSVITESGGKAYRVNQGEATFIPAGEDHMSYNDTAEDCEIVWVLVG